MVNSVSCAVLWFDEMMKCGVSAGSRSSSPQRSSASQLVQCPPDVAAVQRPGSSLGTRSKLPTQHRVAHSQCCSREASPNRYGGTNSFIRRQSELEAAVADALVSITSADHHGDNGVMNLRYFRSLV